MMQLIAFIVMGSRLDATIDDITSVPAIHFVITKSRLVECAFSLPPNATLIVLRRAVALQCSFQYPFQIQLLGETIVSSQFSDIETIAKNPIIKSAWDILSDLWKVPVGFRIPLKVRVLSAQDIAMYSSLHQMFGGLESNVHEVEWFKFIRQCNRSKSCFEQDLCDRFQHHFRCGDGELKWIGLDRQQLKGTIDLSFLPSTVTKVDLKRNLLTEIYGLDRLAGKQLGCLSVIKNPLEIDLQQLIRSDSSQDNPLRFIVVGANQISRSLFRSDEDLRFDESQRCDDGDTADTYGQRVHRAAERWINSSFLEKISVGWKNNRIVRQELN